jgi:hypothetical protein
MRSSTDSPGDPQPNRSKALLTYAIGQHRELLDVARPSFERYAEAHGYKLVIPNRYLLPAGRSPHWAKVALLEDALSDHDLVVWLDADTMIVDVAHDVADDLVATAFQGLVMQQSASGWSPSTGVWAMRSEQRSASFLEEVRGLGELERFVWHDQRAVMQALGWELPPASRGGGLVYASPHLAGTGWLPPEWNWIVEGNDNHWAPRIKHWTGDFDVRLAGMRDEAERQARVPAYA